MSKRRKLTIFFLSIGALFVSLYITLSSLFGIVNTDLVSTTKQKNESSIQVDVVTIQTENTPAKIALYGEIEPLHKLELVSMVSGEIISVNDQFKPGKKLLKNTPLIRINNLEYLAQLKNTEHELAQNKLKLMEEEREAKQALWEWKSAGYSNKPDSPLVLHKPQVEAALASVNNSKAQINIAKLKLDQCNINAPFDAVVMKQRAVEGAYVQPGTELGTIFNADKFIVRVKIPSKTWELLYSERSNVDINSPVSIASTNSKAKWPAKIESIDLHYDEESKQRTISVSIKDPLNLTPPLLPGQYVKIEFTGSTANKIWRIPQSAISDLNEIWYLDEDNLMRRLPADIKFEDTTFVYMSPPNTLPDRPYRIILNPLSSYVSGLRASPTDQLLVSNNE